MGLNLEVGTACNNKCLFCSAASRPFADFSTEQILKLIQENAGPGGDSLSITGGEATIRPDFLQIVSSAVKSGYDHILLQSNGRAFEDEELARKVVNLGLKQFLISLHGADAAMHDALTQVPGSFEQAVRGIKNIMKAGGDVSTLTVITKGNFSSLVKITEMMLDMGIEVPVFAFPMLVGRAPGNFDEVVPNYIDIAPFLVESFKMIEARSPERAWCSTVQDVPFCFLKGLERHANEINYPEMTTICFNQGEEEMKPPSGEGEIFFMENEIDNRLNKKIKPDSCKECIYFQPCEGIQKDYINRRGTAEFIPVTSADPAVEIKSLTVTLPGSLVPALYPDCRFNGRSFGGFLTRGKNLITLTNRGRLALSFFFGEHSLSDLRALQGDEITAFALSLKKRGFLSFSEIKTPTNSFPFHLKHQITLKKLSSQREGQFELSLYKLWSESYQTDLT